MHPALCRWHWWQTPAVNCKTLQCRWANAFGMKTSANKSKAMIDMNGVQLKEVNSLSPWVPPLPKWQLPSWYPHQGQGNGQAGQDTAHHQVCHQVQTAPSLDLCCFCFKDHHILPLLNGSEFNLVKFDVKITFLLSIPFSVWYGLFSGFKCLCKDTQLFYQPPA